MAVAAGAGRREPPQPATLIGYTDGGGGTELHFGGTVSGSFDVAELQNYSNIASLEKKDSSAWTFHNDNSAYLGNTLVRGGSLAINGIFDNSNVIYRQQSRGDLPRLCRERVGLLQRQHWPGVRRGRAAAGARAGGL